MFGMAVGKLESQHARCAPLAGKSTLNRLEMACCSNLAQEQERYVKLSADPKILEQVFLDLFFVLCDNPPRRLFIDLDVTDDPVHGQQAMAFFNRYYEARLLCTVVHLLWRASISSQATTLECRPSGRSTR